MIRRNAFFYLMFGTDTVSYCVLIATVQPNFRLHFLGDGTSLLYKRVSQPVACERSFSIGPGAWSAGGCHRSPARAIMEKREKTPMAIACEASYDRRRQTGMRFARHWTCGVAMEVNGTSGVGYSTCVARGSG